MSERKGRGKRVANCRSKVDRLGKWRRVRDEGEEKMREIKEVWRRDLGLRGAIYKGRERKIASCCLSGRVVYRKRKMGKGRKKKGKKKNKKCFSFLFFIFLLCF